MRIRLEFMFNHVAAAPILVDVSRVPMVGELLCLGDNDPVEARVVFHHLNVKPYEPQATVRVRGEPPTP